MAIEKIEPTSAKFKASDGTTFDDEDRAIAYEAMLEAKRNLEEAEEAYTLAVGKFYRTADGHPLDLSRHRTFYIVNERWPAPASVVKLFLYVRYCEFKDDGRTLVYHQPDGDRKTYHFFVADIYRDHQPALKAAIARREEWLECQQADLDDMKERAKI